MTHCPRCGHESRDDAGTCPRCGETLAAGNTRGGLSVSVGRYAGEAEARMWAEMLQAEGVPVVVVPLGPGPAYHGPGVPHELRVRATDEARARELLPTEEEDQARE